MKGKRKQKEREMDGVSELIYELVVPELIPS